MEVVKETELSQKDFLTNDFSSEKNSRNKRWRRENFLFNCVALMLSPLFFKKKCHLKTKNSVIR